MHANASRVLALPVELAVGMREQMLLIAMLGAAGQRDFAQVLALDARYGGALPREDELGRGRRLLVAWASAGGRGPRRRAGAGPRRPVCAGTR
jgi:hypothetical protein